MLSICGKRSRNRGDASTPKPHGSSFWTRPSGAWCSVGPSGIRLQEVAKDAGVSHPTVLHHFGSRELLVKAVIERSLRAINVSLVEAITASGGDERQLEALLENLATVLERSGHARIVMWLALEGHRIDAAEAHLDGGRRRRTRAPLVANGVHATSEARRHRAHGRARRARAFRRGSPRAGAYSRTRASPTAHAKRRSFARGSRAFSSSISNAASSIRRGWRLRVVLHAGREVEEQKLERLLVDVRERARALLRKLLVVALAEAGRGARTHVQVGEDGASALRAGGRGGRRIEAEIRRAVGAGGPPFDPGLAAP